MTYKEKGGYLDLLIMQFSRGKFTIDDVMNFLREDFSELWPRLKDKFKTDGTYYWNQRLEYEMVKRSKFTDHQSENGKKGGRPKKPKITQNKAKNNPNESQTESQTIPNQKPLEDRNRNENLNELEINNSIEFLKITAQKDLSVSQIQEYWKAFLIHSEGKPYNSRSDKIQHFRTWFKIQKTNINGTDQQSSRKNGKSAGLYEVINSLEQDIKSGT